jgi:hypothetical protein
VGDSIAPAAAHMRTAGVTPPAMSGSPRFGRLVPAQPFKVVPGLQREPQFRAVAAQLAEPQCHFRRHRRALGERSHEAFAAIPREGARCQRAGGRVLARFPRAAVRLDASPATLSRSSARWSMVVLQIDGDGIGAVPCEGDPPVTRYPNRPARLAWRRVPREARQVDLFAPVAASSARRMRPTLGTFGALSPLGSPASKYRLSARLRKLRITGENVMRQKAIVKSCLTAAVIAAPSVWGWSQTAAIFGRQGKRDRRRWQSKFLT